LQSGSAFTAAQHGHDNGDDDERYGNGGDGHGAASAESAAREYTERM
jgi:hypothetical protein